MCLRELCRIRRKDSVDQVMCFINEKNAFFQRKLQRFASIMLEQQVIRQRHKFRIPRTMSRTKVRTDAQVLPELHELFDIMNLCQSMVTISIHCNLTHSIMRREKRAPLTLLVLYELKTPFIHCICT